MLPFSYHKYKCDLDSSRLNSRPNNNHHFFSISDHHISNFNLRLRRRVPSSFYKREFSLIENLKKIGFIMNQWKLTVRQTLFASSYHTRGAHTFLQSHRSSIRQSSGLHRCLPIRIVRRISNSHPLPSLDREVTPSRMFMQRGANVSTPRSDFRVITRSELRRPLSFSLPLPSFRYF